MDGILRSATADQITSAITQNQLISWREFLSLQPDSDPRALFGIDGFITGIPYMMMNSLFDADPRLTHVGAKDIISWFETRHLPMMWFITPDNPCRNLSGILSDLGLELAAMQVPGMYIDLIDVKHTGDIVSKENMISVDESKVQVMVDILVDAFEISSHPKIESGMRQFFKTLIDYSSSTNILFEHNGVNVGCASMIYGAGVAGIYNVSVLNSHRRQGIGTKMMSYLLDIARSDGYQYAILHSSEKGKSVYEKLGFQTQFVYERYLLRPSMVGFMS